MEELEDGQRVPDLMGDLRGEQPECRQALVLAEGLLAHEDARVEAGILQGYRAKARKGAAQALLVVVEEARPLREYGQDAHHVALEEHRGGEDRPDRGIARQVQEVDALRRLDVGEGDGLPRVHGRRRKARAKRDVALRRQVLGVARVRHEPQARRARVVEIERAGPGLHHRRRVAGQRVKELALLELSHERLPGCDERLELPGLAAEVPQLPEPDKDAGRLVRQADEPGKVAGAVRSRKVPIECHHAERAPVRLQEGGRHLAARIGAKGPAPRVRRCVGHQEGLGVPCDPAGNALARRERALGVGGQPDGRLDLEPPGFGVLEGDEAAVGPERARNQREDLPGGGGRVIGARCKGGDGA